VLFVDAREEAADQAASLINRLVRRPVARGVGGDAADSAALKATLDALLEPRIGAGSAVVPDVCVMRVQAIGHHDGGRAEAVVELVDRYDARTGLTAMQRLTGWHAAICLGLAVRGRLPPGLVAVEQVPADLVVEEGRKRGWAIRERVTPIS
jgi:saccharopine dehydrogenase-like NADP-dependent oxidoreductase